MYKILSGLSILLAISLSVNAQDEPKDTFFLAKKKGILGRLGKTISTNPVAPPVKIANPFVKYTGKTIRTIDIATLSFNENINDTNAVKNNLFLRVANFLHKNTKEKVIRNNLFFREGSKFLPLLIADNERYLRDLSFIQDARILVLGETETTIDILVLTKDVFSIGGKASFSGTNKFRGEIKEDNIHGTGNSLALKGFYDKARNPVAGYGAEFMRRNIRGTFVDWTTGFQTFDVAYNTGRREELSVYTRFDRPFVSRYTEWTGSAEISYNKNENAYKDPNFKAYQKYSNYYGDIWAGYNLGYKRARKSESERRFRNFVGIRGFYKKFNHVPDRYDTVYSPTYADINGGLLSYTLYKQNFYRTNFIYGFGRNEDVPAGISATVIGGWINKQGRKRNYYGLDFEGNYFGRKGYFGSGKVKLGSYQYKSSLEDISILVSGDFFTKAMKLNSQWLNRSFISLSYTRLLRLQLNDSLYLRSDFGLPYFLNPAYTGDARGAVKFESVFFHMRKFLGFRLAPFVFAEMAFLKPVKQPVSKTNGYTALGAGIRTRNENLIFGTIELKGYYFPRTITGMDNYQIDLSTKLRFKFNSSFVKRPEFVVSN